ncbi:hypothetical protein [Pseudoruegeria sp. SK021]|uniref:hypothetical protein n=1 Tax=Pseudoruegeria sp. SK021 TaxID=1933035 RepID=UPI000A24E225|nr:hypothetical protein [Pseudoruegeria sp. SK021]OSP56519.1 hypothetical protein BV911_00715 [Pseudoruegeria sp. SK021]
MALNPEHDLHKRRFGQNVGVGLALLAFVAVVFGLTLAKVGATGPTEAFDHVARPALIPQEGQ